VRRPAYCTAKADDEPCLAADVVARLADGKLSRLERVAIERRLDECEVCRRFVAEVLRQDSAEPGADRTAGGTAESAADLRRIAEAETRQDLGAAARAAAAAIAAPDHGGHGSSASAIRLPTPGQRVDRYLIVRPLGMGGMGMVSLASDEELKRHVVIKLVRPDLIDERPDRGETLEARLIREAQALARLSHPCVVSIFDIGRYADQVFFAMEFVEGVDLATYLASAPRSAQDILGKFRQAGAGLGAAHKAGVVHRDFKPANVLVGDNGVVKVADFGLARGVASAPASPGAETTLPGRGPAPLPKRRSSMLDAALTRIDSTVGTPAYMAPEQIAGEGVDARSDQFAFAVSLIDALLGQRPTARAVHPQTASRADRAELDRQLAGAGTPPPHRAALLRAISEEPSARFASMDELLAQLIDVPWTPPLPLTPAAPAPPQRSGGAPLPPAAPSSTSRRRRHALLAVAALGGGALSWWAIASSATEDACAAERRALSALLPGPRRQQLLAALPLDAPFERWTAESAIAALEQRLGALAALRLNGCGPVEPGACQPTAAATIATSLEAAATVDDLDAIQQAIELCDGAPPPRPIDLAARPRLAAAARALEEADLQHAGATAAALGGELSARAPAMAAKAWQLAATAALLSGSADADERIARCTADAERAGDDSRRAQALLLQLELALVQQKASRVEQLGELLRSQVVRRGDRPIDRAEVESLLAAAHDRLGSTLTSVREWGEVVKLADEAARQGQYPARAAALKQRAIFGAMVARAKNRQATAQDRDELGKLLDELPRLPEELQPLVVAAALELDVPLPARAAAKVAARRSARLDATAAMARVRAEAVRAEGNDLTAWFEATIAAATEAHRAREAAELALEQARLAVAAAITTAVPLAPDAAPIEPATAPASPGSMPPADRATATSPHLEAAVAAIKRADRLLFSPTWTSGGRDKAADLALRASLLSADLVEAGLSPATWVIVTRSQYQWLPKDSLLRAEAAWHYASLGKKTSRYLQGEEDLELAIPVWRTIGRLDRAALAAWWIARDQATPRADTRDKAQLALELFRQLGDQARVDEIEAWLPTLRP
jgi:serine/threonine protein kinase